MKIEPSYYAIIPANVRYDKDLAPNAKLLYGEITSLCNQKGYCYAQNSYFSELYGVSKTSISKWISSLINKGYIRSVINYKEGTKEILSRYLTIVINPIEEKLNTPIKEKLTDNIIDINNTVNNKINNNSTTTDVVVEGSKKNKKDLLYKRVIDAYYLFYQEKNGLPPKIDGAAGNAAKAIITYFKTVARAKDQTLADDTERLDDEVVKMLEYVFINWSLVRPFLAGQYNLTQINSNLNNIISDIKAANKDTRKQVNTANAFTYFKNVYNDSKRP